MGLLVLGLLVLGLLVKARRQQRARRLVPMIRMERFAEHLGRHRFAMETRGILVPDPMSRRTNS